MKLLQLLEKVIDVRADLQQIKDQLRIVKTQLVGKASSIERTLEILDDSFRPLGIRFERSEIFSDSPAPDNLQHMVGLDGASFDPQSNIIHVYTLKNIRDVLNLERSFATFANTFLILLGHELIHRHQAERSRVQLKDNPDQIQAYLSQKEEIMAYAHQAAHELVIAFGASEALNKIKGNVESLARISPALSLYLTYFEANSEVRKRLMKFIVEYLT